MKPQRILARLALILAMVGFAIPELAFAAGTMKPASATIERVAGYLHDQLLGPAIAVAALVGVFTLLRSIIGGHDPKQPRSGLSSVMWIIVLLCFMYLLQPLLDLSVSVAQQVGDQIQAAPTSGQTK